jgi:TonB family protein
MRTLLVAMILLCAGVTAATAQTPPLGHGPFWLGMSVEQARNALSGAQWTEVVNPDDDSMVAMMTRTSVPVGTVPFVPMLEFRDGALRGIRYGRPVATTDSRECMTATLQTVRNLETAGLFNGAASRSEPTTAPMLITTAAGSELRAYISTDGIGATYANRRGALYAEITGTFEASREGEAPQCRLMVRFSEDPNPPQAVAVDIPTAAELEAATPLGTPATWIERPDGSDFARHYPVEAMRNETEGRVALDCLIKADGYLRCAVASEEPAGEGFGDAALQIATRFRVAPEAEGESAVGKRIRQSILFRLG